MPRWFLAVIGAVSLSVSTLAGAQDPPKSCEEQLQIAQIELELTRRDAGRATQAASADLARWMQRATAAEKRMTQKPPEAAPTPAPAPPQESK